MPLNDWNEELRNRMNFILKVLSGIKDLPNSILDLGCGDGRLTTLIAKAIRAHKVVGVDIDKGAFKEAPNQIETIYVDLNAGKLPFPNACFDLVISLETIHFLINPDNLLMEAHRVLKPGGLFLISCQT